MLEHVPQVYQQTAGHDLRMLARIADHWSAQNAFTEYQRRLDPNTLRRHRDDLALFSLYLADAGVTVTPASLFSTPAAWEGMSHGLLSGFLHWMYLDGYAIGSINIRLSTVRSYARLASQAGVIPPTELALILTVKGYSHAAGENADQQREQTRKGTKKAQPVSLSPEQIETLKRQHPDTPQGRRDKLLMCLLLDHGLRCGEVAALTAQSVRLSEGMLTFKREKVKLFQRHRLTADTLVALLRYYEVYQPMGQLLAGSRKSKQLAEGMSTRAITKRVCLLGHLLLGIEGLSAHDLRHAWVEAAIRAGTDIKSLQTAGGWKSPVMPLRYAGDAEIANEGVRL